MAHRTSNEQLERITRIINERLEESGINQKIECYSQYGYWTIETASRTIVSGLTKKGALKTLLAMEEMTWLYNRV